MADKKIPIDKHKKQINDQVLEYLRQSETSGCTPTEEQFREFGSRQIGNITINYEDELERPELNELTNTLKSYFETEMIPKYRRSLRDHPRTVNGFDPQPLTQEAQKLYGQTLKEEKEALAKDIKYLIKESERTNCTPKREQVMSWLKERLDEDLAGWSDERGKRYVFAYIEDWYGHEYDKRMSQSMSKNPRKENGRWPWKSGNQEEQDKSGGGKDGISKTRRSGAMKGYRSKAPFASDYMKTYQSFSGYDMVCTIEMPMPKGGTYTQVIGELQTITYSIHQEKTPVRCLGDMNAKGYVFGPRTIAGTLIFTVFDRHWTTKMEKEYLADAGVKAHMLADEFPPLNLTISCANEYGHNAVCSIFGVTLVNEGQVMSINDVFTENTYQFYATDVQYLAPVDVTMGGTKSPLEDLPQVNTKAEPSSDKPIPKEKPGTPPTKKTEKKNPDPEKPDKEKDKEKGKKPKQDDSIPTGKIPGGIPGSGIPGGKVPDPSSFPGSTMDPYPIVLHEEDSKVKPALSKEQYETEKVKIQKDLLTAEEKYNKMAKEGKLTEVQAKGYKKRAAITAQYAKERLDREYANQGGANS